ESWMRFDDPHASLNALPARVSERKLRLFACACARLVWERLGDESRRAVESAEHCADDPAQGPGLYWSGAALYVAGPLLRPDPLARCCCAAYGRLAAVRACGAAGILGVGPLPRRELLRCVFGNPFQADPVDPRWRTDDVLRLAEAVYEERAFDR